MTELVEVTEWHADYADCICPYGHEYARVYIDGIPFLHCLHERCQDEVEEINREFQARSGELPQDQQRPRMTPAEREEKAFKKHLRSITFTARERLLPVLRSEKVIEDEWIKLSPYPVLDVPVEEHWRLHMSALYPASADNGASSIWVGELRESGPEFVQNFKLLEDWLKRESAWGQQISICTFRQFGRNKKGVTDLRRNLFELGSRSQEFVEKRLFVILESDVLAKEEFGAVIKWAQKYLVLRAIVDTGGKSLHAWFERFDYPYPNFPARPLEKHSVKHSLGTVGYMVESTLNPNYAQEKAAWEARYGRAYRHYWNQFRLWGRRDAELNAILEGLGCDPHMLRSTLTARLPGHPRRDENGDLTGRWQRLIYLAPKYPPPSYETPS